MGFYDDTLIGAFRHTTDGRRIWRMRYLVSDADLGRVQSRIKRYAALSIPLVVTVVAFVRGYWGGRWEWTSLLVILLLGVLSRYWIASGLPTVVVREGELEPINERELSLAAVRAMGRPAQWALLTVAFATTVLAADLIFIDGDRSWSSWLLLIVMPICFVGMCRDLWHLRRESSKP